MAEPVASLRDAAVIVLASFVISAVLLVFYKVVSTYVSAAETVASEAGNATAVKSIASPYMMMFGVVAAAVVIAGAIVLYKSAYGMIQGEG